MKKIHPNERKSHLDIEKGDENEIYYK